MTVSIKEAWKTLTELDDILLLTHRLPDGDAVGSLFALCRVLRSMGKRVTYEIDEIPRNLRVAAFPQKEALIPRSVVTVDVGDKKLLGDEAAKRWGDRVDLSIDHHATHVSFAKQTLVDPRSAAAAELLFDLFSQNGVITDPETAAWLYVGIATDTGCFRYANTTAKTLGTAAALVEAGADNGALNEGLFETKTRAYAAFEAHAMQSLSYYLNGRCAVMVITQALYRQTGICENEIKEINALPRQIEGVLAGITLKEKETGGWRVSVRTRAPLNAASICAKFDGGGHVRAAGCELPGTAEEAIEKLVAAVKAETDTPTAQGK